MQCSVKVRPLLIYCDVSTDFRPQTNDKNVLIMIQKLHRSFKLTHLILNVYETFHVERTIILVSTVGLIVCSNIRGEVIMKKLETLE